MFEITILFCCVEFIGQKVFAERKKNIICQGVISGFFLIIGYYCSIHNIKLNGLQRVFSCYILFYLGYSVNILFIVRTNKNIIRNIGGCIIGLLALIILNNIGYINLADNEYVNPMYFLLCALFGWGLTYNMANILSNFKYVSSILCLVGRNTLTILILHFLCFKIVNYIGVFFEKKPQYLVAAFPILYTGKYIWLVYTVVGLAVPVLCKLVNDIFLNRYFFAKSKK